jgi:pimeloyl-ACP methyl ester carboxylesterase
MYLSRRTFLASASSVTLAGCVRRPAPMNAKQSFVLVHGAWHGGWCWRDAKSRLEAAGHRVFTPTLPGLGETRATADVGLDAHIAHVTALIETEQLRDIHLVGHSFGGMVITGVADRMKSRIARITYLDAALPKDGQSMISYGAPRPAEVIAATANVLKSLARDGINMDPLPPEGFGIPPDHPSYQWTKANLRPHPFKSWTDPIQLRNGGSDGLPRLYIHCTSPMLPQTQFPYIAAQVKADPTWRYAELKTGHDAMITDPAGVVDLLLG